MDPKNEAREHLLAAERYLKNSLFDEARNEVKKAQEIDPSNIYTFAFLERIEFFRKQRDKEMETVSPDPPVKDQSKDVTAENDAIPSEKSEVEDITPHNAELNEKQPGTEQDFPSEAAAQESAGEDILNSIKELKDRLQHASKLAGELESSGSLSDIVTKVSNIEKKVRRVHNELQSQQEASETKNTNLENIRDIEEQLKSLSEYIHSFNELSPFDESKSAAPSTQLADLEQEINDIQRAAEAPDDTFPVEKLREKISGIDQRLNELTESIEAEREIGKDFERIEYLLNNLESKVDTIASSYTRETEDRDTISKIDELSKRLDSLQDSVRTSGEIESSSDDLRSYLLELESKLQDLFDQVQNSSNYDDAIEELRKQIDEIKTQIDPSKTPISDIEQQLHQLRQDISKTSDVAQPGNKLKDRIDDLDETSRHLLTNYADLEQRLQEYIAGAESKFISREEFEKVQSDIRGLREQLEDVSDSTIRDDELHQTHAEILSLYTDLEHRFNELIKKQDEKRQNLMKSIEERQENIEKKISALQNEIQEPHADVDSRINRLAENLSSLTQEIESDRESRIDRGEIDSRFAGLESVIERLQKKYEEEEAVPKKISSSIDTLYQQLEEITETLHFEKELRSKQTELENKLSDISRKFDSLTDSIESQRNDSSSFDTMEQKLLALQNKFENQQQLYQSKLNELTGLIDNLKNKIESDLSGKDETKKDRVEMGMKYFRTEVEHAWEFGAPTGEKAAELQNLAELFAIPEPVMKQIIQEVKLHRYSLAVKKAISEKKISHKEVRSLEHLRKQYDVSIEEYMKYESKFLDALISTQFFGTILLISGDDAMRKDLSERLKSVGFAVVNVSSPETALEKIDIINPQVIISDMEFPDTKHNALTLLNVIQRNKKFNFIPFIIATGEGDIDRVKNAISKPNETFVNKPVEFNKLVNTINDQLQKLRDHLSSRILE